MTPLEEFLSDIFHQCALAAYYDVAKETNTYQPDSGAVRKRTYEYYENYILARNSV